MFSVDRSWQLIGVDKLQQELRKSPHRPGLPGPGLIRNPHLHLYLGQWRDRQRVGDAHLRIEGLALKGQLLLDLDLDARADRCSSSDNSAPLR